MPAARNNEFGQPIGASLPDWSARAAPPSAPIQGRFCRLEPINAARHGKSLHAAFSAAPDARDWTYMSSGPFADAAQFDAHLLRIAASTDPQHFAIVDQRTGDAIGTAALMRIDRANGVIEAGHVSYSRRLQRTSAATEAIYLMLQRAFDELGYRRFEWKCDDLNAPSRAAAMRFGFTFEGIFRQAIVYKGRSRDTAWYSMTDGEWRRLRGAYQQWLAAENFDGEGRQRRRLSDLIAESRSA
ncbi:MAG: GNAT family protein [Casimicrobiaceae bacterium]